MKYAFQARVHKHRTLILHTDWDFDRTGSTIMSHCIILQWSVVVQNERRFIYPCDKRYTCEMCSHAMEVSAIIVAVIHHLAFARSNTCAV